MRFALRDATVQLDSFDDLAADGVDRAERGHRLLKDQGNFAAAYCTHTWAIGRQGHEVDSYAVSVEQNLTANDPAWSFDDAQDGTRGNAFAAAAFADDAQRSARQHVEAGPIDGFGDAFVGEKERLQIAHAEQRLGGVHRS